MNKENPEGGISRDATTLEPEDYKKTVAQICESLVADFGNINFASLIEDPFFFDQKSLGFRHHLAVKYGSGASFGELGVLRSVPRAATAIANSFTVTAILDSDNFRKILHQEQWIKIERKMRFFKESMLHDLDYNNQVKIAYYFTKKKYKKGDVIFKQGDFIKGFYIVKSGRIELRTNEVMDVLNLEAWDAGPDIRKMMEYNSLEHMGFKNWQNFVQKVCEVGEKGLLNDWEEGKEGKFVEMYTAIAASDDVVLFECNMHNLRWVRENFPKLWKRLRKENVQKNQQRREMVEDVKNRRIADEKESKGITAKNKQAKIFSVRNNAEDISKKVIPLDIERELTSSTKRIYKLMSQKEKVFERLNSTSREDFEELVRIENRRQPNHTLVRDLEKKRKTKPHSYQGFLGNFATVNGKIVDFLRSSVSIDARSYSGKPSKQNQIFVTSRDNVFRTKSSSKEKCLSKGASPVKKIKRNKTITSQGTKHAKLVGPNSFLASGSSFHVHKSHKKPAETKPDLNSTENSTRSPGLDAGEFNSYQDQLGSRENILIEGQSVEREEKVWYGNLPTRSPEKHELRLRMKLNKVLTGISSIGIVDRDHSPFRNHQKPQKPNLLSHQDLKSDEPNVARPLSFHQPIAGSHPPHPAQPDPTRLKSRFARY